MPYRLATDGGNSTGLLKISFELGQRPRGEAQAQICRARGGRLDDQLLNVPSMDSRAARPFPILQTGQPFGLKSLYPFVRVRVVKVGTLACFPDAVTCGQLPNKQTPSVESRRSAWCTNQPLQLQQFLSGQRWQKKGAVHGQTYYLGP